MKKSTPKAIRFLNLKSATAKEIIYAYLSVATNFQLTQVADKNKEIYTKLERLILKNLIKI